MTPTIHDLKRAVVLRPTDPAARHALAEALLGEGDALGAIAQLERALSHDGAHLPSRRLLARAYARDQRLMIAQRLLEETVRAWPEDAATRDELVEFFLTRGRFDDALIHVHEGAQQHPSDAQRWRTLGGMLARYMLWDAACEALAKAAELAPGDRSINEELQLVSRERDQFNGDEVRLELPSSVDLLKQAKLPGEGDALRRALERLMAADVPGAKKALIAASPAERSTPTAVLLKAEVALAEGQFTSAETALQKLRDSLPINVSVLRRLGDVAYLDRRWDDARARYREALRVDPSDLSLRAMLNRLESVPAAPTISQSATYGRVGMLAWTPVGGSVTTLQAVTMPGRGELTSSGNLGDSLKESAQLAFSLVKGKAKEFGITAERLRALDVHVHASNTDVRKDGRSAGLALTLAIIAALREHVLPEKLAVTGEISLLGDIIPVAGIREKVSAAYLMGYRTVLLPRQNLREAQQLPVEVTSRVRFVYLDSAFEAYRLLFTAIEEGAA